MLANLVEKFVTSILTILVLVILWGYVYYKNVGEVPSLYANQNFVGKIRHDFEKDGYQVEVFERKLRNYGDPSLVVFVQDNNYKDRCDFKKNVKLKSPRILISEQYESPLRILFNSKYLKEKEVIFSDLNQEGFWLYDKKFIDLDDDQDDEIVVKYLGGNCGSGTEVHQVVFDDSSEFNIVPTVGVPSVTYSKKCTSKDCSNVVPLNTSDLDKFNQDEVESFNTGVATANGVNFPFTNSDHLVEFVDIDGKDGSELVFAHPEWKEGECHFCSHYWVIGIYKYENGQYYPDGRWNNGLLYKTQEKISLEDGRSYKSYSRIMSLVEKKYNKQ